MKQIYQRGTGIPSYAEAKAVMQGRLAPGKMQINHTVPKYVQKLLGITDEGVQDSVPALILKQVDHTGAGDGSFHNILYKLIAKETPVGKFTRAELISKLQEAYSEFGHSDVGTAAIAWLVGKGIP